MWLLPVIVVVMVCLATGQQKSQEPSPVGHNYATRSGRTITLHPAELAFDIPADWVSRYRKFHNNLHLSAKELQSVREGHGTEWDTEYAKVVNSVLPFRDCVVHVGGLGWGQEGSSYPEVQLRAYLTKMTEGEIKERISRQGFSTAKTVGRNASLEPAVAQGGWQRLSLTYYLFYQDYGGTARIDFYVRSYRARRIVLGFMYGASHNSATGEIAGILQSFRTNGPGYRR